jgi:phosphonate transport system substrate-binding protein
MTDRRTLLKTLGVVGAAGLAGCTGGSGGGDTATDTPSGGSDDTATDTATPTATEEPTATPANFGDGEIDMNVSPSVPQDRLQDQYSPIRDYLSDYFEMPAKMNIANNYSAVIQALGAGTSDIAETGPFAAALGVKADKAEVILQRKGYGSWTYVSTIRTAADSDIESLQDLKDMDNPTIAFSDRLSTSGCLYPLYDMKTQVDMTIGNLPEGNGSNAEFDAVFAGGHSAAYEQLRNGQADAAGMGGFIPNDGVQKINTHDGLPRAPIVVSPELADSVISELQTAFLEAPDTIYLGEDGEPDGDDDENPDDLWFSAVREADVDVYQSVIDVANELNIGTEIFQG